MVNIKVAEEILNTTNIRKNANSKRYHLPPSEWSQPSKNLQITNVERIYICS